ncbi:MAG: class II fructose-bisphosphate aldolase [Candidatus Pacebacteria bacterium]|nr:class II fructose-bisphosphate aldolase [Candidatus Paceibacterota bacterium]
MKKVFLASLFSFYKEDSRDVKSAFSVPAFNLRLLAFDCARALFRAAQKVNTNVFIIEIAQSEMGYTRQTPKSFARQCLAAAQAENYQGPIFLQGDHFKPKGNLKGLIKRSIKAGFFNIDIDCSALPLEQNIAKTNRFIDFIKDHRPDGVEMNIGAEVGEIGGSNTSPEYLRDFLQAVKGITKVAVQTGTSHGRGGQIDWQLLNNLSAIAKEHGLAGVVQHGASTLSEDDLRELPKHGVCEVHLATELQDVILEHPLFPREIKKKISLYQNKKEALGPLKKEIERIPQDVKDGIMKTLEDKFVFYFNCLGTAREE